MEEATIQLLVQGGALSLLALVIVLVVTRVLPEERKTRSEQAAAFIQAIERHEEGHKDEITTILNAHKESVDKLTEGERERLVMLADMRTSMAAQTKAMNDQTEIMRDAFGLNEARAARREARNG